ncbi:hypothetical protein BGX38DRAFT_1207301 [Terfezia claveryi]|nr:hypothetical protein BGX38DRAFT_1207301 [Terfezia claveryi]
MENIKSISIFISYFLAIVACAFVIVRSILGSFRSCKRDGINKSRKHNLRAQFVLFVILTSLSFGFTWYNMLRFFHLSYTIWSTVTPSDTPRTIGNWLHDTELFEEAYRIVVITPERWWWSQQIFLACFGWGVWVSYQGKPGRGGKERSRKVLTAYMVLAQLVSLSVAVNLYFVDVLAYRGAEAPPPAPPEDRKKKGGMEPRAAETGLAKALLGFYLMLCFIPTALLPTLIHSPQTSPLNKFFPALLLPHVALFIPIFFAYPISPRFTRILYTCLTFGSVACHVASTLAVIEQVTMLIANENALASGASGPQADLYKTLKITVEWLGETILNTHPAVSSVSWDVVWFVVSMALWAGIEGGAGGIWVKGEVDRVGQREGACFIKRVMRVVVAAVMMAVAGAGAGSLIFAADL